MIPARRRHCECSALVHAGKHLGEVDSRSTAPTGALDKQGEKEAGQWRGLPVAQRSVQQTWQPLLQP